jgi:2-succinyl-6-hydroxy-2,4-cyclohexadiene-1-carboxylate synthase
VTIPVLVIAGALDTKFTEIGLRMAAAIPNASLAAIDGAGHAVHTEQPEATAATISDWLTLTAHP